MKRHNCFVAAAAGLLLAISSSLVQAAPYASDVKIALDGLSVSYVMNQDSDLLEIDINGAGYAPAGDGTLKGSHSFAIPFGAAFSIRADKTEDGFTQPDGGTVSKLPLGIAYNSPQGFAPLLTSDTNPLNKFNSPRGLDVSRDPNAPNFGNVYISNSAAGTTGSPARTLTGRGVYALKADQTDAYGLGDAAAQSALFGTASTNSPFKLTVASNGEVYVTGYGDALSGVWRLPANMSTNTQLLGGTTGPGAPATATCTAGTCLPVGQNHGSVLSVQVSGSTFTNDLTLYTIDEDFTNAQFTRASDTDPKGTDNNKILRYNIGGNTLPYTTMPTVFSTPFIPGFVIQPLDMDRGADGKSYVAQLRSQPASAAALYVLDSSGNVIFNSVAGTAAVTTISTPAGDYNHDGTKNAADYVMWRKQQGTAGPDADGNGDSTVDDLDYNRWRSGNGLTGVDLEAGFGDIVNDLYTNVFAVAVSPDQKWLATLHNIGTIVITPLVNGIPDVANRLAVNGGTVNSARDIAFDAAGNLHFVNSAHQLYRVIAPGGHTVATTSWNGSSYAFNVVTNPGAGSAVGGTVPEPGTLVLLLTGVLVVGFGRRRR